MKKIINYFRYFKNMFVKKEINNNDQFYNYYDAIINKMNKNFEIISILNSKLLIESIKKNQKNILRNINLAEFKVFSQWGDDGIIQFLINYLDIEQKVFIEFGVEDYSEANTRFLLINNNWSGLIIDGSKTNIDKVINSDLYWRFDLKAINSFVTAENIDKLILSSGIKGNIGLLHIDIDGNDYWVWKKISVVNPVIVIIEYNSVFGSKDPWTISYEKDFFRTKKHHSNLFFGSSLLSLCDLANEKGYSFIGCNSNGNNAYFVRDDKLKKLKKLSLKDGYVMSKFRESRNKNGELTFISGKNRINLLKGMEVFNTRLKKIEKI